MNALSKAAAAGAVGAATTTVLHEVTRRIVSDAPRVDLLGMQGLARMARATGHEPPTGKRLFAATLAADIFSNSLYYGIVSLASRETAVPLGGLLGALAGIGAVVLPEPLGFSPETTSRTARTKALAALLYTAGGFAAGFAYRMLSADEDVYEPPLQLENAIGSGQAASAVQRDDTQQSDPITDL